MAAEAGFGPEIAGVSGELIYWHLSGGFDPGRTVKLFKKNAAEIRDAVRDAQDRLCDLIDEFDQPRPRLSVAATSRAGTAVLRLRTTRPGRRMVRGGDSDE